MTAELTHINLTIDGSAIQVPQGTTVYQAAKQLGIEIPVFCYHDRLPPFGACRMCLVEVERMPRLQTACTLEVAEGMVVRTQAAAAVDGRKEVIEFLLINHPLDCPICDRGGECPLQDNTWQHGAGTSRFYEEKRRFKKPLPLGPLVLLDRERCIACARCTRFSDLVAGDHALEFKERGYRTEVGTPHDGEPQSKFIGNTIMICPVGALTSQTYRFRARPWDNAAVPTTCTLCPVGCSLAVDARDGKVVRTRSRENRQVNDVWLCDKGWFGYEFVHHPARLDRPWIRKNGTLEPASWEAALDLVAFRLQAARPAGKVAAFGGNPLTCEENYLFQQLIRQGGGVDHLDHRLGLPIGTPEEEGLPPGMESSIEACTELAFVVLLGLDLTEEFPVIWLRLREALNKGAKMLYFGHFAPEIAPYCLALRLHPPGEERLTIREHVAQVEDWGKAGQKGAIFVGSQYLASPERASILADLWRLRKATPHLSLHIMEGRGNSLGARWAGMHPHYAPLGVPLPKAGWSAPAVLTQAAQTGWDFLYVAGCNPHQPGASSLWQTARRQLGFLVVQELFLTETARQADVVLPALSFLEKRGSFINIEGRVQSLEPAQALPTNCLSDGEIFRAIGHRLNLTLEVEEHFLQKLQSGLMRWPRTEHWASASLPPAAPTQGLRATFARALFDLGERMRHNPHLARLAHTPYVRLSPEEGAQHGIQDGSQVSITAQGHAFKAQVRWDRGVAPHTVVLPLGFASQLPLHDLSLAAGNGFEVCLSAEPTAPWGQLPSGGATC